MELGRSWAGARKAQGKSWEVAGEELGLCRAGVRQGRSWEEAGWKQSRSEEGAGE